MYLLKSLTEKCILFSVIIVFELYTFVVICIMLNQDRENSIENCLTYLFNATLYGEYHQGALFPLQLVFTIVQLFLALMLAVYLIKDTQQDYKADVI